jgi:hypothetical protein
MKGILIDAKNRTTTMVNNAGDLSATYEAINADMVEIGWFDTKTGDTLWISENGRIDGTDFGFSLFGRVFYGNGIIFGSTIAGDNTNVKLTLEQVTPEFLQLEANPEIEIEIIF